MKTTHILHGVHPYTGSPCVEEETITQHIAFRNTSARFWVLHSIRLYIKLKIKKLCILSGLLLFSITVSLAQRGKLPAGIELAGRQKLDMSKCEVCFVFKTNEKGEKAYFYYDVKEKQKLIPDEASIINIYAPRHSEMAFSYKMPDGKIYTKFVVADFKSGKVERPINVVEQPENFKGFKKIIDEIDWYYIGKDRISKAAVFDHNGEETYALYDYQYNKLLPQNDWKSIDKGLFRINRHGYLELLKQDYTIFPDRSSDKTLGLIPTPIFGTFLVVHWVNQQIKYSLVNIYKEAGSNEKQIITSLSEPIYDSYGLILPVSFAHDSSDNWASLLMSNDTHYDLYGKSDWLLYSGINRWEVEEKGFAQLWFSESEMWGALSKMEKKWQDSFQRNKSYWKAIEERNRISREKWQAEVSEKEHKNNVTKYKICLGQSDRCDYKFKDLLPAQVMSDIKEQRQRAIRQQAEINSIPNATEMNYRTFDDHVMKNLGYTRKVWKNGQWEYVKD